MFLFMLFLVIVTILSIMKKLFVGLVSFFTLSFFMVSPVGAITAEPESGIYAPNSVVTVVLNAYEDIEGSNATAVQIRLDIEGPGSTIVAGSWDDRNASNFLSIGTCTANNDEETSTSICLDMAKTQGSVQGGEILGSFKIQLGGAGVTTVQEADGNGYLIGSTISDSDVGRNLAQYTVQENVTPTPTPLPVTGIEDYPVFMIAGLAVIFAGVGFFIWREKSIKTTD